MVCATSKVSDQPAHTRSLIRAFTRRLNNLLTEHDLEFLSLKGGFTGLSESTLVKQPHCWKSHVTAHIVFFWQDEDRVLRTKQMLDSLSGCVRGSFCSPQYEGR